MVRQMIGGGRHIGRVAQVHALAAGIAQDVVVPHRTGSQLRRVGQFEALAARIVGQAHRHRHVRGVVGGVVQVVHGQLGRVAIGARTSRQQRRGIEPGEIEGDLRVVVVVVVAARVVAQMVVEARIAVHAAAELVAVDHELVDGVGRADRVHRALVGRGVAVHPATAHVV